MTKEPIHEELEQGIHDITEGKQAEGKLRENEERYQTILESNELPPSKLQGIFNVIDLAFPKQASGN